MSTRPRPSARALRRRARLLLLAFFAVLAVTMVAFAQGSTAAQVVCLVVIAPLAVATAFIDRWQRQARIRETYAEDATPGVCSICGGRHDEEDCPLPQDVGEAITRGREKA